jgi:hypothetical protein
MSRADRDGWSGDVVRRARAVVVRTLPADCPHCRQPIHPDDPPRSWIVGHLIDRALAPHLMLEPTNWRAEHDRCSRRTAQQGVQRKAAFKALVAAGWTEVDALNEVLRQDDNAQNGRRNERRTSSGGPTLLSAPAPGLVIPDFSHSPQCIVRNAIAFHREGFVLPRIESVVPDGVSYELADEALEWMARNSPGEPLLPWQRYVVRRALETDADGRLLHPRVLLLVSRQQGKTFLMRRLLWWRVNAAERFGQRQEVLNLHLRYDQAAALVEPWARDELVGLGKYRMVTGRFDWTLPDLSVWRARAMTSGNVTGRSHTCAFVDEVQDAKPEVVLRGLLPTMSGSRVHQPQAWFAGTGERDSSTLLRQFRQAALAGSQDVLLLEWSAPKGCESGSVESWRWSSPDWSDAREQYLRTEHGSMTERDFRSEYLVQHDAQVTHWLPETQVRAAVRPDVPWPPSGCATALEVSLDGQRWGAAAGWPGQVLVREFATLPAALEWLLPLTPSVLLAHEAVVHQLPAGLAVTVRKVTAPETTAATQLLEQQVRAGLLQAHGEALVEQLGQVVTVDRDGGRRIDATRSRGDVQAVKAAAWVCWWSAVKASEPAAIF